MAVMLTKHLYSDEPSDKQLFTDRFDRFYSQWAISYDWFIRTFPLWRNWLDHVIPHLQGEHLLEVSFGTGYLLTQYPDRFATCGVDYNKALARIAREKLERHGVRADLQVANVEALPYADESFDTLVNTMSFTGYPDARRALAEMHRVLRPGGRLVMIDINFPANRNRIGTVLTKVWQRAGDIIRDMGQLFDEFGFEHMDTEIGGFGSVHLYVATRTWSPGRLPTMTDLG